MKNKSSFAASILTVLVLLAGVFLFHPSADAAGYKTGDSVALGRYPQTRINDDALIARLETLAQTVDWEPIGLTASADAEFAFFRDVSFDGSDYRAIRFTKYIASTQSLLGYQTDTVYWFRFEPIRWTVLDPESGLLIADTVLDAHPINLKAYDRFYADEAHLHSLSNYAYSHMREWLNGVFSRSAFSATETELLLLREQDNSLESLPERYRPYACENTSDSVFLLSYSEAANTDWFPDDESRRRVGSDYAHALGLYNYSSYSADEPAYEFWFLRSPYTETTHGYISPLGAVSSGVECVSFDVGVCPAVYADLNALSALNAPASPYDGLVFDYADGILTVSGSGSLPAADDLSGTPLAPFTDECRVVVVSNGVDEIGRDAFKGFAALNTLILNGRTKTASAAFSTNDALRTVICADEAEFAGDPFPEGAAVSVYEPKNAPHVGDLGQNCEVLPYSFADGTLYVDGDAEMNTYTLLDLMTVMCGYFDDIQRVRFHSYASEDVTFYAYSAEKEKYVPVEHNVLEDVGFSVMIPGENAQWEPITFNEFCALAAQDGLDTFRLVADVETGEAIKENAFKIITEAIGSRLKAVLKWLVGLLNYMFSILSRFR